MLKSGVYYYEDISNPLENVALNRHCWECKRVYDFLLEPEVMSKIEDLIDQTHSDGLERGFSIIRSGPDGFKIGRECIGDACSVYIEPEVNTVGSFHTHVGECDVPLKEEMPHSEADISQSLWHGEKVSCVGLNSYNGSKDIACICLKNHSFRKWLENFLEQDAELIVWGFTTRSD